MLNLHPLFAAAQRSVRAREYTKEAGGASVRTAEPRLLSANGPPAPNSMVSFLPMCLWTASAVGTTTSRERLINIFMSVFVTRAQIVVSWTARLFLASVESLGHSRALGWS